MEENNKIDIDNKISISGAKVYTYTPGEYDVLADTTLEEKIDEFSKKIDELDEHYKEIKNRLESLNGNGVWKSDNQVELYSYLNTSVTPTFSEKIENWKKFKEFLEITLKNYMDFDKTYDDTIDENKAEFDVNESQSV